MCVKVAQEKLVKFEEKSNDNKSLVDITGFRDLAYIAANSWIMES